MPGDRSEQNAPSALLFLSFHALAAPVSQPAKASLQDENAGSRAAGWLQVLALV